jgi:hypothetical protein
MRLSISEDKIMNNETPKKIAIIKLEFMQATPAQIPELQDRYSCDERSGVITICNQYRNKAESLEKELERTEK